MFHDLWQFALPVLALGTGAAAGAVWQAGRVRASRRWPTSFPLTPRPLFTTHERLLFRELKAALPQHVVLAKLNLLRFCQATSERDARVWFDRLHTLNVTFAVCTPQGVVISVIDLDTPQRRRSERGQRLKEAVLESCRIRYLRCQPGQWPRAELLGGWALGHGPAGAMAGVAPGIASAHGAPDTTTPLAAARDELARKLHRRRAERASRFHDSQFASDSFFAEDSRGDQAANSAPAPLELTAVPAGAPHTARPINPPAATG